MYDIKLLEANFCLFELGNFLFYLFIYLQELFLCTRLPNEKYKKRMICPVVYLTQFSVTTDAILVLSSPRPPEENRVVTRKVNATDQSVVNALGQ